MCFIVEIRLFICTINSSLYITAVQSYAKKVFSDFSAIPSVLHVIYRFFLLISRVKNIFCQPRTHMISCLT